MSECALYGVAPIESGKVSDDGFDHVTLVTASWVIWARTAGLQQSMGKPKFLGNFFQTFQFQALTFSENENM